MFGIRKTIKNGFDSIVLYDTISQAEVIIAPAYGAILLSFSTNVRGVRTEVIDPMSDSRDFKSRVTSEGFKGCKLSPFVCRLHDGQYNFDDNTYKIEKYYLQKHALHGLIYDCCFTIINQEIKNESASIELLFPYAGSDHGFPFQYDCTIKYTLRNDNALKITTTIANKGSRPMPLQDGWHPYFKLNDNVDELQLQFDSKGMIEFDDELIPTGEIQPYSKFQSPEYIGRSKFDNCFLLNFSGSQSIIKIRNIQTSVQLEISPQISYPYLQIYIPDHRKSIALENLSSPPDAFNNNLGLIILNPEEEIGFTTNFQIKEIKDE